MTWITIKNESIHKNDSVVVAFATRETVALVGIIGTLVAFTEWEDGGAGVVP